MLQEKHVKTNSRTDTTASLNAAATSAVGLRLLTLPPAGWDPRAIFLEASINMGANTDILYGLVYRDSHEGTPQALESPTAWRLSRLSMHAIHWAYRQANPSQGTC